MGVKYYDTNIVRSFKTASATEPNVGNVVARVSTEQSSAVCSVNGKTVDCPESLSVLRHYSFSEFVDCIGGSDTHGCESLEDPP